MTEPGDKRSVRAAAVLADYASADPSGKINMIGGNVTLLGYDPAQGETAPFTLWVTFYRLDDGSAAEVAAEITLVDESSDPVAFPNPLGATQPIRLAQNVQFRPVMVPGMSTPRNFFESTAMLVLNFAHGLPLRPGGAYRWEVKADTHAVGSAAFAVRGPVVGPVLG